MALKPTILPVAEVKRGPTVWMPIDECPKDEDMPGGVRVWRMRDAAGNVYKGKRTLWNKTGYTAQYTNQPITPTEYADLEDPIDDSDEAKAEAALADADKPRRGRAQA
jgi:hypothetical protein